MKQIDIQQQPLLSFGRTARIALTGVRYRLFRATVTVAVIAVAMAFLMNILAESLIKKTVAESARGQIEELHRVDKWITRLSVPQTTEEILAGLAAEQDPAVRRELRAMCGLDEAGFESKCRTAQTADMYLEFFDDLNYGRKRVLVGSASGAAIFDRLQTPADKARFFDHLKTMKSVRFISSPEAFESFLSQWPDLRALVAVIRDGQAKAIRAIQPALAERTMLVALEDAQGGLGDAVRGAGFGLDAAEAQSLATLAQLTSDTHLVDDTINRQEIRKAVAAREDILPGEVTVDLIWRMLLKRETAAWYLDVMQQNGAVPARITTERLVDVARARAKSRLLVQAEMMTTDAGGGFMGIGQRMSWLAIVSILVCIVGIANAMLMSVTERFREIATLKCLGALDGFIMTVFLIEACILGLVGGVIGSLAGLAIGAVRMAFVFQGLLVHAFPVGALVIAAGVSIGIGIGLAVVAAVYPSLRAARLAPMEAMRIE